MLIALWLRPSLPPLRVWATHVARFASPTAMRVFLWLCEHRLFPFATHRSSRFGQLHWARSGLGVLLSCWVGAPAQRAA